MENIPDSILNEIDLTCVELGCSLTPEAKRIVLLGCIRLLASFHDYRELLLQTYSVRNVCDIMVVIAAVMNNYDI